jgi:transcriptional regulator with XRE-family HTH domain
MNGEEIRKVRDSFGLNQTQFGQLLNVHWTTISAWERGVSAPGSYHIGLMEHFRKVARDKSDREFAKGVLVTAGAIAALAFLIRALVPKNRA